MGETITLLKPTFNRSVEIESCPDHLTADAGALIQREIMERSGIMDWLVECLDPMKVLLQHKGSHLRSTQPWFTPNNVSNGCADVWVAMVNGRAGSALCGMGLGVMVEPSFKAPLIAPLIP